MSRLICACAALLLIPSLAPRAVLAEDLPEDAARLVAAFEEDADGIRRQAEEKIAKQRKELAVKLKELQDQYCKAAKLDEAVAIRDKIRMLGDNVTAVQADPGTLWNFGGQIGTRHYFRVTGNVNGFVWGTDVYTADSTLAMAAVHAGAVKTGETAVVRVTVLPGRNNYLASTRNGVTTSPWTDFPTSFSVERVREPAAEPEKKDPPAEGKAEAPADK